MRREALGIAAAVAAGLCGWTAPAAAEEPVHVHWESLLPAIEAPRPAPTSLPECPVLRIECVDEVAERLRARADALGCDHRAVFARNYQRLTEVLRPYIVTPGFYSDPQLLIAEVVVFARLFDEAYDDPAGAPEAWRIAFGAWRQGDTYAVQDLLLGINAHVQRDMPYVLAELGLGTKADHDKGNEVLDAAYERIVAEVAEEYDPATTWFASPLTPADDVLGIETVRTWREGVWRNAEALVAARTPAERALVERRIEENAAAWARLMSAAGPPGYGRVRDAYCASRRT